MLHTLPVADIRRETPDCVSVAFQIPAYLEPVFEYEAGQYITLEASINGEKVRRSYSLCSSPFAAAPAPYYPSREKERPLGKNVVSRENIPEFRLIPV